MAIRVLIVDDSLMARELLKDIFEEEADFVVVGLAEHGKMALSLAAEHQPDLITMDLEMPIMDGFQAIQEIMQNKAYPILVVSSVADAKNAYRAISNGAVDVIGKPGISPSEQNTFIKKARIVSKIPVIKRMKPVVVSLETKTSPVKAPSAPPLLSMGTMSATDKVICIASSTGGPQALTEVLKEITTDFNVPILIAQHISDGFAEGMAQWLDTISPLNVKVGEAGELVRPNTVYISPSEKNMVVNNQLRIALMEPSTEDIYHPNCNMLLESVADVYGDKAIGIILSGMGSDGAAGLRKIVERGGMTIGQDEQSSVIYGMNQVAMKSGAVKKQLPLKGIVGAVKNEIGLGLRSRVGTYDAS